MSPAVSIATSALRAWRQTHIRNFKLYQLQWSVPKQQMLYYKSKHTGNKKLNTGGSLASTVFYSHRERLTLPAEKVTIGRKIMPNLASGTFVQTAASTAMTAPDCGQNKVGFEKALLLYKVKQDLVCQLFIAAEIHLPTYITGHTKGGIHKTTQFFWRFVGDSMTGYICLCDKYYSMLQNTENMQNSKS